MFYLPTRPVVLISLISATETMIRRLSSFLPRCFLKFFSRIESPSYMQESDMISPDPAEECVFPRFFSFRGGRASL